MSSCKALPQNLYNNKKSTIIKEDDTKYVNNNNNNNIEHFTAPPIKTTVVWIFSLCAALFLSYYCNNKYSNFTPPTIIIHILVALCCPQCYICYILIYSIFNNGSCSK